jgi:hypothetical protein
MMGFAKPQPKYRLEITTVRFATDWRPSGNRGDPNDLMQSRVAWRRKTGYCAVSITLMLEAAMFTTMRFPGPIRDI